MDVGWFVGFLTASHFELKIEKKPARRGEIGSFKEQKDDRCRIGIDDEKRTL